MTVLERIQNYLGNGGLFNPELMEHEKVRDLIMACRDEIATLRQERDDADQYIKAIWRADRLPSPLSDRLFNRLTNQPKSVADATGLRKGPALDLAETLYREGHTNLPPNLADNGTPTDADRALPLRDAAQAVYDRLHELGCFTDEQEILRAALAR